MLLHDSDDALHCWQYAERYLGGGTRTYSKHSEVMDISAECHPQLGAVSFKMISFWVPDGRGDLLTNGIASRLPDLYRDGGHVLMPVHPDALASEALVGREELLLCEPGPWLEVVPSANARTVFVTAVGGTPVPPHFLKLHYPRRLSRFTRRLRRPMIELELWVADELALLDAPFLAEVCGGVFGSGTEAWGFMVREAAGHGAYTVPLFALYGRDIQAPDPSLLQQLVDASGERADTFIADRIVAPMIRFWVRAVVETGCVPEAHGQNTLISFTPDGRHVKPLYRDCGIYVDPSMRERKGLTRPLPPVNVISRDVSCSAAQVFSLAYDSFMGHHALDYLAIVARERLGVDPRVLHEAARATFADVSGDLREELLPDTVYYYDDSGTNEQQWSLVDTGRRPQWR